MVSGQCYAIIFVDIDRRPPLKLGYLLWERLRQRGLQREKSYLIH
jgi:hypothetical protein